jgi:hypothetical protein
VVRERESLDGESDLAGFSISLADLFALLD